MIKHSGGDESLTTTSGSAGLSVEECLALLGRLPPGSERPASGHATSHSSFMGSSFSRTSLADIEFRIQAIFEETADRLRQVWHRPLRGAIQVEAAGTRVESFGDFIAAVPNPSCVQVFQFPPLEGRVLLVLPVSLTFNLLDRLMGGRIPAVTSPIRPLTELERRLVPRLTQPLLQVFANAFQCAAPPRPELERIENNPRVVRCFGLTDSMRAGSLQLNLGGIEGSLTLVIAERSILAAIHEEMAAQRF